MTQWKTVAAVTGAVLLLGAVGAGLWLWTPSPPVFDTAAARAQAAVYGARVIRDAFGVPHIHGQRHADVAFGLAYAHAEDDWATIEETVHQNRGTLALLRGPDAAPSDFIMRALGNIEATAAGYDTVVSPTGRAVAEGYAAGLNLWCAENPQSGCARTAPVVGREIVAGYANRSPFFYGLDKTLLGVIEGEGPPTMTKAARAILRGTTPEVELGSNAIAVAPRRSADGHTRLAVNSHQPFTGPVAWYEARLKSEEGIDLIGGVFPGSPLILHGAGPAMGWAATVNHPDVADVFRLTVDDERKPTRYRMDGAWKALARFPIRFRVKLWGPFSLPVTRTGYRSEHGPVFVTQRGVFAVSYAGDGEIRHIDQYIAMNTAKSVADWRAAQATFNATPSINYVVADSAGHIGYFWNARMPVREEGFDRTQVLPGDVSATLWKGVEPVARLPAVSDPASGYVLSANHSPLLASAPGDNPNAEAFPSSFGLDTLVTNRSLRAQALYGGDASITREEFLAYKMDHRYDDRANVRTMVAELVAMGDGGDAELRAALELLASWNGAADAGNRAAALAIRTGQVAMGGQIHDPATPAQKLAALRTVMGELKAAYGRIDPTWGEVSRLRRGTQSWPLNGGPDTLRAIYADGDLAKDGFLTAIAGDTYIVVADWAPDGTLRLDTIHQFGAATLDTASPHFADQAPLFARETYRTPPMTLEAVLKEKTRDYRPGK